MKRAVESDPISSTTPKKQATNVLADDDYTNASNNNTVVVLNVGGEKFTTTKSTLCGLHISYFSAMFGGRFTHQQLPDGSFFIDRNGKYFHYILEFLREGSVHLPKDNFDILVGLYKEAKYYTVLQLQQQIYDIIAQKAIVDLFVGATKNRTKPAVLKEMGDFFDAKSQVCKSGSILFVKEASDSNAVNAFNIFALGENNVQKAEPLGRTISDKSAILEPELGKRLFDVKEGTLVVTDKKEEEVNCVFQGWVESAAWINPSLIAFITRKDNKTSLYLWNIAANILTEKSPQNMPTEYDFDRNRELLYNSTLDVLVLNGFFTVLVISNYNSAETQPLVYNLLSAEDDYGHVVSDIRTSSDYMAVNSGVTGVIIYNLKTTKKVYSSMFKTVFAMFGQYVIVGNYKASHIYLVDFLTGKTLAKIANDNWQEVHVCETNQIWKIVLRNEEHIYCYSLHKADYGL